MTAVPRSPRQLASVSLALVLLAGCMGPGPDAPTGSTTPPPATDDVVASTAPSSVPPDDDAATTTSAPAAGDGVEDEEPGTAADDTRLAVHGVSAGHPLASEAGVEMLEQGGTAVDAAIAAAFADAVVQPVTSGLGGGGAALVAVDGEVTSFDYREVVNETGVIPPGGAGIPGFVAGMERLHAEHGQLPWEELLRPGIELAEDGVPVSGFLAMTLAIPGVDGITADLPHFRGADGAPLGEGDLLVQDELARTMTVLAEEGAEAFYEGTLAPRLTQEPGMDAASLAGYELQVSSSPPSGRVGGHTLVSAAPPLPGAALVQLVQVAEAGGVADVDPWSADFVQLQSQAWAVAEESVQTLIGDPDFVDVPVDRLTDPDRNAAVAAERLGTDPGPGAAAPFEGAGNTTHISVVAADGSAVSMTNTITHYWGSGRYVDGYFLNDQLTRFDALGTTAANEPSPGRRSVSWSTPSMVLDEQGRPALVIGTPGGQQIPNTIAAAVLRWSLHDAELADLVAAPRFIHTGGEMVLETAQLEGALRDRGYAVRVVDPATRADFGSLNVLEVDWDEGTITSVADERRAAGFSIADTAD
ncbi:gamma-glutamyltransferase [uncultured Ornithinimicrobium sp.]|uniref:gamma-glutamyltransferase n=1 Tax=uncultured Ornithinimicrobium sp. TaxID=259307 RepID=UPI002599DDE3|nr:gamma-glutamyltransferase [uncultured Ornithinimicrobium sp.]